MWAPVGWILSAVKIYLWRRIPRLEVRVKSTGGDRGGLTFTAECSEVGNIVPATDVVLTADLEDVSDPLFVSQPFNLGAGQLEHPVRFAIERPKYGTLVKACNHAPTLYGKTLTVTIRSGRHRASTVWREESFNPETDAGRHAAMQEVWERHRRGMPVDVADANERRRTRGLTDERYLDPE